MNTRALCLFTCYLIMSHTMWGKHSPIFTHAGLRGCMGAAMSVGLVPVQTCAHARIEIYACAYVYAYVDWICIVHSCCVCLHESGAQQNARETIGGGPGPMASIAIASVRGHNMYINLDQERTWTNYEVLLSPPNAPCLSFYPLLDCSSLLSTSLAC